MSVEAVNNVSNNVTVNKQVEKPIGQTNKVEDKKNGTTLLLGSLAALAIGGGIYFATRGKKGATETGSTVENSVEQIKEMAIDAFKKAGNKFEKGKALKADGTAYTGDLTQTLKDGTRITREYKDGIIQKSTKLDGENVLFEKRFFYEENGDMTILDKDNQIIFTRKIKDGFKTVKTPKSEIVTDLNNNGRFIRQRIDGHGEKRYYYSDDGQQYFEKHEYSNDAGLGISRKTTCFNKDGSKLYSVTGGGEAEFFDKNGNVIDKINIGSTASFNFAKPASNSYYYDGMNHSVTLKPDYKLIVSDLEENGSKLIERYNGEDLFKDIELKSNDKHYVVGLNKNNQIISIHCGETNLLPYKNQQLYDEISKEAQNVLTIILDKQTKAQKLLEILAEGRAKFYDIQSKI
jgi:hypothetical protein